MQEKKSIFVVVVEASKHKKFPIQLLLKGADYDSIKSSADEF